MRSRGFTLIELIVVMAIISILVMLAAPNFMGYGKDARVTRIIVESKEIEKASEKYYMVHSEWPRLGDIPYTNEEIVSFTEKIMDSTGKVVMLEEEGNYYDIDYPKIHRYLKEPKEGSNYILQNPVGMVYYLDGMTDKGVDRIKPSKPKEPESLVPPMEYGVLPTNISNIETSSTTYWDGKYYDHWDAFDGKYDIMNNGWMSSQKSNAWLAVTFKTPQEVLGVGLVNSSNVYALGEYRCKDFKIEYFDEQSNTWLEAISARMENKMGWQHFNFESKGSHLKWRLLILNHGYGSSAYLGIGEIEFLGK